MRLVWRWAALGAMAAGAVAAKEAKQVGYHWPTPAGWKAERIPFPLDFAPDLPFRGVEELRFARGFLDARAPGFWSYAFVWYLDPAPAGAAPDLSPRALEDALRRYFLGLTRATGGGKYHFDEGRFAARLASAPPSAATPSSAAPAATRLRGTVSTYDSFTSGKELTLNVAARFVDCGAHRAVLFTLSPKPYDDPIWQQLAERDASFTCR